MVSLLSVIQVLGVNVDGYVMLMFLSQIVIVWNSDLVIILLMLYDELVVWMQKYLQVFGYNGIKNGMFGVSFVVGWIYVYGIDVQCFFVGFYDKSVEKGWQQVYEKLKVFNKNVIFILGNVGMFDMLSWGEIVMGLVWVDMFYSWKDQGKLLLLIKFVLLVLGMLGQLMYYVILVKVVNLQLVCDFIVLVISLEVQVQGIVKQFNWYLGIDVGQVKLKLDVVIW